MSLLATEEFIISKCEATGSLSAEARIDGMLPGPITLISIRVLPADLPAPAKSLVGETITVTETQNWSEADSTGHRTATVSVEFSGPMKFEGRLQLDRAGDNESSITTTGKFTAKLKKWRPNKLRGTSTPRRKLLVSNWAKSAAFPCRETRAQRSG